MKSRLKVTVALVTLLFVFFGGAVFYHYQEKWRWVDSFYFSAVTITTVGYGDIYPVTESGRIFTIFFVIIGVSLSLFSLTTLAGYYFEEREKHMMEIFAESEEQRFKRLQKLKTKSIEKKIKEISNNIKDRTKEHKKGLIDSYK